MMIKKYIIEQFSRHATMRPEDVIKLCYQAAMGAEHLLSDPERAKKYFDVEFADVEARDVSLFEKISDGVARVDLGAWKAKKFPPEWLFNMFYASANPCVEGKMRFFEYLAEAEECFEAVELNFTKSEWVAFTEKYLSDGLKPIHHSLEYRESEKPSYRIIDARFLTVLPILERLADMKDRGVTVAIDGRAASGKTTAAELLSVAVNGAIVRMDDFFLPPILRTAERLEEAGGNIHYERFEREVLPYISMRSAFEYGIFDCGQMAICGKRAVREANVRIVEGSYSQHPRFGEYADVRVFLTVSHEEQMRRVRERNGEEMAKMFAERWIPMEEKYFDSFSVKEKAHILINTEE